MGARGGGRQEERGIGGLDLYYMFYSPGIKNAIICGSMVFKHVAIIPEEDKRATTNVQNGLVFLFLLSFIIFSSL